MKKYIPGRKDDSEKARWSLLPMAEVEEVCKVLAFGAKKYQAWNWQKVANAEERYRDAAYRHMRAICLGENNDQETGLSHYAHAICSLLFAAWHSKQSKRKNRAQDDGPAYEK